MHRPQETENQEIPSAFVFILNTSSKYKIKSEEQLKSKQKNVNKKLKHRYGHSLLKYDNNH